MRNLLAIALAGFLGCAPLQPQNTATPDTVKRFIEAHFSGKLQLNIEALDPLFFEVDLNGDAMLDLVTVIHQPDDITEDHKEYAGCAVTGPLQYPHNKKKRIILPAMLVLHGSKGGGWGKPDACFLLLNSVYSKWFVEKGTISVSHLNIPVMNTFEGTYIVMLDYEGIGSDWFWDGKGYRENLP